MNVQEEEDPDLPDVLYTARYVSATGKTKGETGMVAMYRAVKEKDPIKFLAMVATLEKDWQDFKVKRLAARGTVETDEGEAAAMEKLEMLLKEFK